MMQHKFIWGLAHDRGSYKEGQRAGGRSTESSTLPGNKAWSGSVLETGVGGGERVGWQ